MIAKEEFEATDETLLDFTTAVFANVVSSVHMQFAHAVRFVLTLVRISHYLAYHTISLIGSTIYIQYVFLLCYQS